MYFISNARGRSQTLNTLSSGPSLREIVLFGLKATLWVAAIPLVLGLALKFWG